MRGLDIGVIVAYLVASAVLGLWLSGRQKNLKGYFLGDRDLPWWAVSLSVVATETSALTVISVPAVAYLGDITFLQLAFGYLVGRVIVAFVLLPKYYAGEMVTAYAYLGKRFGRGMQGTASVAFLGTRLLADGVRMFACAIPVKVILDGMGMNVSFFWIIVVLSLVTVLYTYIGGIRAVVWVDVFQMGIYIAGAVLALVIMVNGAGSGFLGEAAAAGKTRLFDLASDPVSEPYAFITAFVGGALLSMASHGADQIIVQRLLSCRSVKDAQLALIGSGVIVALQFALFLFVGLALWGYYDHQSPEQLGFSPAGDDIFPRFVSEELPAGIAGLMLAGILAAAMSTLSSSLSALSSSTMADLYEKFVGKPASDQHALRLGRVTTFVWGGVFIVFASMFTSTDDPVVELGLSVAGITYGGLLGAFFLGIFVARARQLDAIAGFVVAVVVMAYLFLFQPELIGFTWYTGIGLVITMVVGTVLSLTHDARAGEPQPELEAVAAVEP